jgi:hypothetical protein
MGNFKVLDTVPDVGNIKVGDTNVKRIYKGGSWVWPPLDDSYIPDDEISISGGSSNSDFGYIANLDQQLPNVIGAENSFTDVNGFALFNASGTKITPAYPFGPLPRHTQKLRHQNEELQPQIVGCSDNYKYMIAAGRNKYNANLWQYHSNFHPVDMTDPSTFYGIGGGNHVIDTIVITKDYGQSWDEFPTPEIPSPGVFEGYRDIEISASGKVIIISYVVSLREPEYRKGPFSTNFSGGDIQYEFQGYSKYLISRDFGETFTELNVNITTQGFTEPTTVRGPEYARRIQRNLLVSDSGFLTFFRIKMSSTGKSILITALAKHPSGGSSTSDIYLSTDFGYNFSSLGERSGQATVESNFFLSGLPATEIKYKFSPDPVISGNGKVIMIKGIFSSQTSNDRISLDYGETFVRYFSPYDRDGGNAGVKYIDYTGNIITYQDKRGGHTHVYNWITRSFYKNSLPLTQLQRNSNSAAYTLITQDKYLAPFFYRGQAGFIMSPRGTFALGFTGTSNSNEPNNVSINTGRFFTNPNTPSFTNPIASGTPNYYSVPNYWHFMPVKVIKL